MKTLDYKKKIVFLGVGKVAKAVRRSAPPDYLFLGTTRDVLKATELNDLSIKPLLCKSLTDLPLETLLESSLVLASFPPDGITDQYIAPRCLGAELVVYISSTAVYGDISGLVDENTPIQQNDNNKLRILAEESWRASGATILRVPGFYDYDTGLHIRIKNGAYKIPGTGQNSISRIHLDDLAMIILTLFQKRIRDKTYVVGDLAPISQIEVVKWLCEQMSCPLPPSVPLSEAHYTQRANRKVVPDKVLKELGVTLAYPSYKEGFTACLKKLAQD